MLARQLVESFRAAHHLPAPIADLAALHLLDAIGVGLAASTGPPGRTYHAAAEALGGVGGPATVLGSGEGATPAVAALANGGLIHALEYDDTHTGSIVHGSSVLAATVLAAAEARPSLSGARVLQVFALGWEAMIRIGLAAPGGFQREGFQITSVAGAPIAALLAAELAGASVDEAVHAMGIALSQSSGVFEFLTNGATVKSLHPGWAAHAGICAAALARAGLTGPATSLEGRLGLFARFANDRPAADRLAKKLGDLGTAWHLADAAFKFHPCCHYIHPFLQALDRLEGQGHDLSRVEALTCLVPAGEAPIICEPWEGRLAPTSAHEMRYSLPVVLALRMLDGRIGLASFDRLPDEAVLTFARRIRWEPMPDADFPTRFQAEINAKVTGGATVRVRVEDVFGGPGDPASRDDVLAKFRANAGQACAPKGVEAVERAVLALNSGTVGEVTHALRRATRPARQAA